MNSHQFDEQKWRSYSIFEQMGNVGSEVGRAIKAKKLNREMDKTAAFYRGLDLIDATVRQLIEQKSPRAREVLRAREQFARTILTDDEDPTLEQYFMQFAIAARLNHY